MKNIVHSITTTIFVCAGTVQVLAGDGGGIDEQYSFDTPSHNMCCTYTPAGGTNVYSTPDGSAELSCSRIQPKYWTVSLTEKGKFKIYKNPGEVPGCGNQDIIAYGETRRDGAFKCTSKTSGLTCTVHGKGFTLSKAGLKTLN